MLAIIEECLKDFTSFFMAAEKKTTVKKATQPKHVRDGKSSKASSSSHVKKGGGGTLNPGPGKRK